MQKNLLITIVSEFYFVIIYGFFSKAVKFYFEKFYYEYKFHNFNVFKKCTINLK